MTDQHVLAAVAAVGSPLSRAEVAEIAGLSKPAVSAAVARLTERGVLHEVGVREGRRGGVATLYELNADHGRSLAVVIQNDRITVQARDLRGAIRAEHSDDVPTGSSPEDIVPAANRLIAASAASFDAPLLAAAVSIADVVDTDSDAPVERPRAVFPEGIRPAADLDLGDARHLVVDNDVNWATVAEHREGSLRGCDDFVYVYAGQGLGAGLLLGGRLFRGHRGLAGEIGYLRNSTGAGDITQQLAVLGLGAPEVYGIDLARADSILTSAKDEAVDAIADVLGLAVANLAIALNPQAIAFGGPLSAYPALGAALQRRISELSLDPPRFVTSDATPLRGVSLEAHRLALEAVGMPASDGRADA